MSVSRKQATGDGVEDKGITEGLSSLPLGWCWARVNELGEVKLGRQRSPEHHQGPHMRPYLRVANVFEDRIDLSDVLEMGAEIGTSLYHQEMQGIWRNLQAGRGAG